MSLSEERIAQRLDYITGSDAAIICGISPYGNIVDLYNYKTRKATAPDISNNPYVKAGNFLEPSVCAWFEAETGKKLVIDDSFIVHKTIDYMAANIDRRVVGESAILEAKTASSDKGWGDSGTNEIPDHYLCQVAHYAAVCDVERVYIAVLIRGVDFRWYVYERCDKLEQRIIEKEAEFWTCVKDGICPEPRTANEVVSYWGTNVDDNAVVAQDEQYEALHEIKKIKSEISKLEEQQKIYEDKIKVFLGNKTTIVDLNNKVIATWKPTKPGVTFDTKTFEKDNADMYSKYLKETNGYRRFLVK